MNHDSFSSWLELYGKGWTLRDPKLLEELFTKDAKYYEKPFSLPFEGIDSIKDYWKVVAQTQSNIKFEYKILSVSETEGIAHWKASFSRKPKEFVKLDGIFVVTLNSKNKCTLFKEWWQSYKTEFEVNNS
jgi:hypothetical protein